MLPHNKETIRNADLRRGERDALRITVKRLAHVSNEALELCRTEKFLRHQLRYCAQHRRAILHDFFHLANYTKKSARWMLRRVEFPPKFLAEVLRLTADAFQIIKVSRRDFLQHSAHMRHRHGGESVLLTRIIQMTQEKTHQLAAFGLAFPPSRCRGRLLLNIGEHVTDGFHCIFINSSATLWKRRVAGGAGRDPRSRD